MTLDIHEHADAVFVALLGISIALLIRFFSRFQRTFVARSRAARALRGERDAEQLLLAAGYRILDRQVSTKWQLWINGVAQEVPLRADLLVSLGGRRLVAEVKTGEHAPRITTPETRRQLLEYFVAYGADGVVIVTPESGKIEEITFAPPPPKARTSPTAGSTVAIFITGFAAGFLLTFMYLR